MLAAFPVLTVLWLGLKATSGCLQRKLMGVTIVSGAWGCCQPAQASPILWTPQVVIETDAVSYAFRFMSFDDLEQVVIHVTMSLKKVFPDSSPG